MGTLLFSLLLAVGVVGLLLLPVPSARPIGSRLAKVGLLGALVLAAVYILVSLVTLPFD
jgi:hypothetical protein